MYKLVAGVILILTIIVAVKLFSTEIDEISLLYSILAFITLMIVIIAIPYILSKIEN
ncbi:hypothetical protein [Persephonella sp. KM09-Lau-8]|uniref:hypothetical protein n=1 Tax=Persephonella sp. KM09-Lau-8 TaxID=1158345 RepID=UPI0012DBF4AE|nr:hypothetical protein [Persephonella sp. KM09-Lau-8]